MEVYFVFTVALVAYFLNIYQRASFSRVGTQLNKKESKINILAFFIIIVFMFILIGFRDFNGYIDTAAYTQIFYKIKLKGLKDVTLHTEIGYNILVYAFTLFDTPLQLNIFCAFFILLLISIFIKKYSSSFVFSAVLFFSIYFIYAANIVRHIIAATILLWALDRFIEKKDFQGIVLILLATTFHKTAIIFLVAYFFRFVKVPQKLTRYFGLIFVLTIGLAFFGYAMSKMNVHRYFNYLRTFKGFFKQKFAYVVLDLIPLILFLPFKNKKETRIPIWTISMALIFDSLSIFNSLMSRIGIMFNLFTVAFVPKYLMKNEKTKVNNTYGMLIITIYIVFFISKITLSKDLSLFFPWKFVLL